ncbi:MAG: GNAT family N-acetyltransferase [Calditrichia bacterium]
MNQFNILNREMTPEEMDKMNSGFDQLSLEEGLEPESSDRLTFVALDGNTFIGCSSGLVYKNGDNYSGWFFLTDLFVEKKYRSQGLGTDLLKTLEEQAIVIGVKNIWLWTSGFEALKFYRRHGYYEFIEMESWYSDGSSRVGLRKNLSTIS